MTLAEQLQKAYDLAGGEAGKSMPESVFTKAGVDVAKLKRNGFLGSGSNDIGRVHWIKNKCVIAIEDGDFWLDDKKAKTLFGK